MESLRPWGFASRQFTDEPSTVYTSEAQIATNRCKLPVENLQRAVLGEGLNYLWKLLLSYKWQHIFTCKTFSVFRQGVVYAGVLQRGLGTWCRTFSINRALLTGLGAKKACRAVCKMDSLLLRNLHTIIRLMCCLFSNYHPRFHHHRSQVCDTVIQEFFVFLKTNLQRYQLIGMWTWSTLIYIGYRICVKE